LAAGCNDPVTDRCHAARQSGLGDGAIFWMRFGSLAAMLVSERIVDLRKHAAWQLVIRLFAAHPA
jgi:hypothetical protein